LDSAHRIVIVEAKPVFYMFRQETLFKALAALRHFGPRGVGYLLVDERGRTLAELAYEPFDTDAVSEVEQLLAHGPMSYRTARRALEERCGRLEWTTFASIVVNRDWAVSSVSPVRVSKLPAGISFRPMLPFP
jgi:hypothetical protein